ncbi:unnamed protein product, partial [Effrenium voratum]
VKLQSFVESWDFDLTDPLTLSRFLLGDPKNLQEAQQRLSESCAWRKRTDLANLMRRWGVPSPEGWRWQPQSPRAQQIARFFFGRVLPEARTAQNGPVLVLRLGAFDIEGAVREELVEDILEPWIFMVEQVFQLLRHISSQSKRPVKLACVVDMEGVSFAWLQHLQVMQKFSAAINRNYPEMAATLTVLRAPSIFTWIWSLAAPVLLEEMTRKKVAILGHDFSAQLAEHAQLSLEQLPAFLGGRGKEVPKPLPVPPGIQNQLPPRDVCAEGKPEVGRSQAPAPAQAKAPRVEGAWWRSRWDALSLEFASG